MKKQISFEQYRGIDLSLLAVMLIIFEFIIVKAATSWFPEQPFTFSLVAAVTAIVMMRWGGWSAIHAVIGGLVFCAASGAAGKQYIIYCIGNLFAMAALAMLKKPGWERVRNDALLSLVFGLSVQLLMQMGRATVALALGGTLAQCAGFFTTDALSDLMTMVIIWVVRRLDGLFENQKSYLLRVQKELEKERGGN